MASVEASVSGLVVNGVGSQEAVLVESGVDEYSVRLNHGNSLSKTLRGVVGSPPSSPCDEKLSAASRQREERSALAWCGGVKRGVATARI